MALTYFQYLILVFCVVALALAVVPVWHYTQYGYQERREEIIHYFNNKAIASYFDRFRRAKKAKDPANEFQAYYDQRFGRVSYRYPIGIYLTVLVAAICWIFGVALQSSSSSPGFIYDPIIAWALAGAYFWVIQDLLSRFARRDLVPSALYGYAFRFIICIPLTYALELLLPGEISNGVKATLGFGLGVFPTNSLVLILRRQVFQRIGLGDEVKESNYELENLQGVTTAIAEKFSDLGVATNVQLAYEDPIQLTMRMNLPFRFIIDVMSQALLAIYCEETEILRKYSIRSSMDAAALFDELEDEDSQVSVRARSIFDSIAKELGLTPSAIEKTFREIKGDPANEFLTALPF